MMVAHHATYGVDVFNDEGQGAKVTAECFGEWRDNIGKRDENKVNYHLIVFK